MLAKTEGACKNVQSRNRDNIGRIIEANKQNKQNKTNTKKQNKAKPTKIKRKKNNCQIKTIFIVVYIWIVVGYQIIMREVGCHH